MFSFYYTFRKHKRFCYRRVINKTPAFIISNYQKTSKDVFGRERVKWINIYVSDIIQNFNMKRKTRKTKIDRERKYILRKP